MLVALKQFLMGGSFYGPPTDPQPIQAALESATAERTAILARVWMPGEEAEREALLAEAEDRITRATRSLAAAKQKRLRAIPVEHWQAQRPRVRAALLRGRYVLQVPDGAPVPRKGSRARRADVLAASH